MNRNIGYLLRSVRKKGLLYQHAKVIAYRRILHSEVQDDRFAVQDDRFVVQDDHFML